MSTDVVAVWEFRSVDDFANNSSTTGVLRIGGAVTGVLETQDDADWFRVTLEAGKIYSFTISGFGASPINYPCLQLFGANGVPYTNEPGTLYAPSTLIWKEGVSGTFYLSAAKQIPIGSSGGGYEITAVEVLPLGPDDRLGTIATTSTLTASATPMAVDGVIEADGDEDWFRMNLTAGVEYYFQLDGHTLQDPRIKIYNGSGDFVDQMDDGGVYLVRDSSMYFTPATSGVYYVSAGASYSSWSRTGYEYFTGSYTLTTILSSAMPRFTIGDDVVTLWQPRLMWFASWGNDKVYGTTGLDNIDGGEGNDTLYGGGGDDVLRGGAQYWEDGDDLLFGEAGNDQIRGGTGNDTIYGGDGDDSLYGEDGTSVIFGGEGNDSIMGSYNGADTLDGGAGADGMDGGFGDDIYYVDNAADVVNETFADGGFDIVIATANFTLQYFVEQLVLRGAAQSGSGWEIDNILYGLESDLALTLNGNGGNDVIYGSAVGGNTLLGGAGVDTLLVYGGNNTANGGTGSDIYYTYTATDVLSEAGGDGIDTVYATYSITVGEGFEQVLISGAATSITSTSATDNNIFYGNSAAGAVTLNGGGGADVLFGGSFADALNGGAGVDLMFGNGGADVLAGGDDTDVYYLTSGTETIVETLSGGFDTAYSNAAGTTTLASNVEQLILYGAATGGTGNGDANYLYGHIASGAVTLDGAGGADYLLDNAASGDILIGGTGNDLLDLRTGGNDFIRYAAAGTNADTVLGFDADAAGGQDLINVSGRGFSAASIGGAVTIAASGADTLVTIGTDTIRLVGVASANVTAADFVF